MEMWVLPGIRRGAPRTAGSCCRAPWLRRRASCQVGTVSKQTLHQELCAVRRRARCLPVGNESDVRPDTVTPIASTSGCLCVGRHLLAVTTLDSRTGEAIDRRGTPGSGSSERNSFDQYQSGPGSRRDLHDSGRALRPGRPPAEKCLTKERH